METTLSSVSATENKRQEKELTETPGRHRTTVLLTALLPNHLEQNVVIDRIKQPEMRAGRTTANLFTGTSPLQARINLLKKACTLQFQTHPFFDKQFHIT
jgi:hypothetical protein